MTEELKIGVFFCECGEEISGPIDIDKLISEVSKNPKVAVARKLRYGCSEEGRGEIGNAIGERKLNRVLAVGCTPRTHESMFRRICEEAGVNRFLLEMVNIKDQCSLVHTRRKRKATEKAIVLTRMGLARLSLLQPRRPITIDITPVALVMGGGVAGMTSALSLAKQGILVKLVEKEGELGGMLRNLGRVYPSMADAGEHINAKAKSIEVNPNIQLFMKSEVDKVSGHIGDYHVTVMKDEEEHHFRVGGIILATGAAIFEPNGAFGYGKERNVITQFQFEQMLYHPSELENIASVVMIQCVGARDEVRPYCSRICCMTALKNAALLRESYPRIEVSVLFRDLETAHILSHEDIDRARGLDIKFYRYNNARAPRSGDGRISFYDEILHKNKDIPYDLLVLSPPLVAQPDARTLSDMLKIPVDDFGFFPDTQMRLRPFQFLDKGIYVCGTAHWPATVAESMYQATGVAARLARQLSKSRIESEGLTAEVDEEFCRGCKSCLEACSFSAITMETGKHMVAISKVDPFLCNGCGACTVVCPTGAMSTHHYTNRQFFAQIDAAMTSSGQSKEPTILGFCCIWGGYASADLAGAKGLEYPSNVKIIRVDCSARVDPAFIMRAFEVGADGVLIAGCPIGECHYQNGNEGCGELSEEMMPIFSLLGIERQRLRSEWIGADEGKRFAQLIKEFSAQLKRLGPSPSRPK